MDIKETLIFVGKIGIIILMIPIAFFIGINFHPEGGVEIYHVNIIYQDHQDNYAGEKAQCNGDVFAGCVLAIRFYNLTPSRKYTLFDGHNQSKKLVCFEGRKEFVYWMNVDPGDEFFLACDGWDLIWIEIER